MSLLGGGSEAAKVLWLKWWDWWVQGKDDRAWCTFCIIEELTSSGSISLGDHLKITSKFVYCFAVLKKGFGWLQRLRQTTSTAWLAGCCLESKSAARCSRVKCPNSMWRLIWPVAFTTFTIVLSLKYLQTWALEKSLHWLSEEITLQNDWCWMLLLNFVECCCSLLLLDVCSLLLLLQL